MIEYIESQLWHLFRMAEKFCDSTRLAGEVWENTRMAG
jgi:hypothetical protein